MAVMKHDMAYNELFIRPIRRLYTDYALSVEEFKDKNAGIMKNHWVDTHHGNQGEKIYELFDSKMDGEIVKESLQEWLCDNRNEITQCIGIALRNHERSYAEWFKYVDDRSGPDELALYSLSRKHGIHTSVFNKSYVWTTLMDHVNRSDEEIITLCGVNLVFLGPSTYGIIRDIHTPQPHSKPNSLQSPGQPPKQGSKVTCRDSTRGRKSSDNCSKGRGRGCGSHGKRSQTLSESRQENFRISVSNVMPCTVRSSRQTIDYLSLNDGLEDETPDSPKRRSKHTYRPQSGPSANRLAAHKRMSSPESIIVEETASAATLSAVPTTSNEGDTLTGVPVEDQNLPDLVLNRNEPDIVEPVNVEQATKTVDAASTEEDLEAASTLLSLGDIRDNTLDEDDENAQLMPIGGVNALVDVAPEPLRLDQVSVDNVIAGIVETEELEKDLTVGETQPPETQDSSTAKLAAEEGVTVEPLPDTGDQTEKEPVVVKGALKTKTYALKKKPDSKRTFKCSECKAVETSIHKLNEHHRWMHNPQMYGICNCTFALASSLTRHMYDHYEKKF